MSSMVATTRSTSCWGAPWRMTISIQVSSERPSSRSRNRHPVREAVIPFEKLSSRAQRGIFSAGDTEHWPARSLAALGMTGMYCQRKLRAMGSLGPLPLGDPGVLTFRQPDAHDGGHPGLLHGHPVHRV